MINRRRAFTWVELVVVLAVTIVIGFFAFQWAVKNREVSRRVLCAKQLRLIGQALLLYSNDNKGVYPRVRVSGDPVRAPVFGTGSAATQPFTGDGPQPNDVTAGLFLLLRTQDISADAFICPTSNALPDHYGDGANTPQTRSNFTDYRKNLSYSYHNPYTDDAVEIRSRKFARYLGDIGAEFAIAADLNPGTVGNGSDAPLPTSKSSAKEMQFANSVNHRRQGQNILYGDGHVAWENNPFVGVYRDNIYTTADRKVNASPYDMNDSILLPTDD